MSNAGEFPVIQVAVTIVERAGFYLVEYNPKWESFSLPMSRQRRHLTSGVAVTETPETAAVRAAAKVLGRPLSAAQFPRLVPLRSPYTRLRSGRDAKTKDYRYSVFAMRVSDPAIRHSLGWHTLWMRPADLATHVPVSESVTRLLPHLPEDLFAE